MKKLHPKSKSSAFKLCLALLLALCGIIYGCRKEMRTGKETSSVNEAKQIGSAGNIKLTPGNATTDLGAQMSDKWINQTIAKMQSLTDPATKKLGDMLKANSTKISKAITAVDKTTKEIVVLKLVAY